MIDSEVVIVLVNYNSFDDTKDCIESIRKNENILPFIIIVDNNSNDTDRLDELINDYPNLHIIKNNTNDGFGRANNIGIRWAFENLDFKYLLLLNNDTLITKNAISKLIPPFQKEPDIGVTTSKIMYENDREIVWYGGGEINYKRGWPKITDFNHRPTNEGANKARYVSFISGCVMMFSKKCLKDVKGFDNDFFMYCEDLDLCIRLKKKGYKLWYEPESLIYHKVQGSLQNSKTKDFNASNPNLSFLFYHMKSNQWLAMKKNLSFYRFVLFNLHYWPELIYKVIKLFLKGRTDIRKPLWGVIRNVVKTT